MSTADGGRKHGISKPKLLPLEGEVWQHGGPRRRAAEAVRGWPRFDSAACFAALLGTPDVIRRRVPTPIGVL
jgi:hypothetical protein